MKNLKFILTLFGCTLILFACGNQTTKLSNSLASVQEILPKIAEHLNKIQELETSLQSEWEEELAIDPNMSSYPLGEGAVFDNIRERQDIIAGLKKEINLLQHENHTLSQNMNKNKPMAELQIITSSLSVIIANANHYIQLAEPQLVSEIDFFKSLSQKQLDYDSLNEKIVTINAAAIERQECVLNLNDALMSIDKPIRIAKARLHQLNDENQQ